MLIYYSENIYTRIDLKISPFTKTFFKIIISNTLSISTYRLFVSLCRKTAYRKMQWTRGSCDGAQSRGHIVCTSRFLLTSIT